MKTKLVYVLVRTTPDNDLDYYQGTEHRGQWVGDVRFATKFATHQEAESFGNHFLFWPFSIRTDEQEDGPLEVQHPPLWLPGPNDPPLWMDAVNASPTAMLSACKTFLACPPAERGSPVLEELFRAVVQQAEQQFPKEES